MGRETALVSSVPKTKGTIAAGDAIHEIPKVFGSHVGDGFQLNSFLAHKLGHCLLHKRCKPIFIYNTGVAGSNLYLRGSAHGRSDAFCGFLHHAAHLFPHFRAKRANDSLELGFAGNDVSGGTRMKAAHCDYGGIRCENPAGYKGLKRSHDLTGDGNRINAAAGICAVTALAADENGERVGSRVGFAVFQTIMAGDSTGAAVPAENGVHIWALQAAGPDHALRTAIAFFVGLEEELYVAAKRIAVRRKNFGSAHQRRGMQIMPAGVHNARVFRGEGEAGFLLNRKCVDVGAKADGLARLTAVKDAENARFGAGANFNAQLLQILFDERGGTLLAATEFRMGMNVAAEGNKLFLQGFCFAQQSFRIECHEQIPTF